MQVACKHCGKPFLKVNKAVFCSQACQVAHWNEGNRIQKRLIDQRSREKRRNNQQPTIHTITCIHCSTPFTTTHKRKYCTQACSSKASNRRQHPGPHTKQCQVCSKPFTAQGIGQKNCSIECRKIADRARYARVRYLMNISLVEIVDKRKVFEAYNWHCALCGIPTPKELRGTFKPNEPTLDHIIPLSKGGSHTYKNVQLLCRRCNCTVKKNKLLPQGVQRSRQSLKLQTAGHGEFSISNV